MASKTYVVSGETAIIPVGRKDDSGANAVQFITVLKGFTFDGDAIADAGGISASDRLAHLVDVGLVTQIGAPELAPTQSQPADSQPDPVKADHKK